MDYSKYLIPLDKLKPESVNALVAMVNRPEKWNKTDTSFRPRSGFRTFRELTEQPLALREVVHQMDSWLSMSTFKGYEANVLEPGAILEEHTDIAAKAAYKTRAHEITKFHKLNIALQGSAEYWFRRDLRQPMEQAEAIEVGDVMLFNNYVYHEVRCTSEISRINLTLFYTDPLWTTKFAIYNRLGIDTNGY